ncbi:MAG TPA: serine hydrolase [Gemmatimonadaceae bacterium]|nr:serine hydrolase [Gemmatimonadaceae bacterium]
MTARFLILLAFAPGALSAQRTFTRADTARLHRTLDSIAAAHHGVVGYAVRNVDTGEKLSLRGDSTFPTASLIKMSVLVTLYDLAERDSIRLSDPISVTRIDMVPGSGMLQYLHDGIQISVGDAAWLMSTISDNTATNLLLRKIGIRRTWAKMESLGLMHTKIHAESFRRAYTSLAMDSSTKYGLGVTTPNEMAHLFELLALGRAVNAHADSTVLGILANNTNDDMLHRYVADVPLSHKDGEDDDIRTDCGLFRLQSRVVVCALTKENKDRSWRLDNEAQLTLANIGTAVVNAWPRK